MPSKNIFWFKDILSDDIHTVGEKGVRLADLFKNGVQVPEGFAITSHAFDEFIRENKLQTKAKHLMQTANHNDPHSVSQISYHIKKHFNEGDLNSKFKLELYNAYKKLVGPLANKHVKIFLSPVSESHLSKHNKTWDEVKGEASLIHSVKECWGSNFSEINLIYNTNHSSYTKSVIIQRLIEPDKSGKVYTIDPSSSDKNTVIIKSMLGEFNDQANFISMPDIYEVDKNSFEIISIEEIPQAKMKKGVGVNKKFVSVSKKQNKHKKLTKNEIEKILEQIKLVEKVTYFPQEIDWSIEKNKLYFTHIKPLTNIT